MENKYQASKNYNFMQDLTADNYIDAKDTVNHWCVAQVIDIDHEKNTIKVHFDGWTSRYDETLKKNSQRFAPFRRHTEGYTGQKKIAIRDFKINLPHQQLIKEQIVKTIEQEFKNFESPHHLTQFIRGELYFYIDSLISLVNLSSVEDLPTIFDFMQLVFKLIFKWMEIFPQYLKSYQESLHHPNLYLIDMDAAIANCGNELFDILNKCFGGCMRCQKFFQKYNAECVYESTEQFVAKDQKKSNGLQASFVDAFGNMRGFDTALHFINFEIQDSKGKSVKGCPFSFILNVLRPFVPLIVYADKKFMNEFCDFIRQSITKRLDNLQESEIKELDKDILIQIIQLMKQFTYPIDPQNCDQIAELYELKIAEKYLRCNFFEKRVRGINELKDIYYKVQNSYQKNKMDLDYTRWLNYEKYSQWILSQGIIGFIFTENPHVELIKRSFELLRLLALDEKNFTPEIMDMLWSCCKDKHEDIIRATLDLIQDLAVMLPLDRLSQFFTKLQTIREQEYDEKLVSFLKIYTINTMKNIRRKREELQKSMGGGGILNRSKKEAKIDEAKYIDLRKFWLIFQDSNKVSQKVKDSSLNSLIEILIDFNDKEQKDYFIQMSLENIKKADTFYSSLIFLRKILNSYPFDAQQRLRTQSNQIQSVTSILSDIFTKSDLFDMIFTNAEVYLNQAQKILSQGALKLLPGEKLGSQNITGIANHDDFIWAIFDFIEFVLINSKVTLKFENVEKMFNLFVTRAICEYETDMFFQLITKENEKAKSSSSRFLLEDRVRNEVFQKIFCNNKYLNCERINLQGFVCFKRLFLIVNEEEKSVERPKEDRVVVVNLNSIQGLETLWQIAIQCENQEVKEQCKDFLVDLYLKIRTKTNTQRKQANEIFPQKCLQYFKSSQDRPEHQLNCLRLIKNFISRFDGDHIEEENLQQYDQRELKTISVTLNPDKATIQIQIHPSQKFWQLKRRMANAFKLKLSEFFIKTKQGPLDEQIYDEPLKEYTIAALHISRVPKEDMEREFPRYLIGYNDEYLNLFLELLKSGQEDCKRELLSLFEILPISTMIKSHFTDNILKFSSDKNNLKDYNVLFSWSNKDLAKPCYFFMVLEELIIPRRDFSNQEQQQLELQSKQEFAQKFVISGGFMFLVEVFKDMTKINLERDITKTKILTIILKIFFYLFQKQQIQIVRPLLTNQIMQSLIQETLQLIHAFITTVKAQQERGLDPQEVREVRFLKSSHQVLYYAQNFINKALISHPLQTETLYEFSSITDIIRTSLIDIEVDAIQKLTNSMVMELCLQLDKNQLIQVKPSFFFMNIFLKDCLDFALSQNNCLKTQVFFDLMNEIFMKTEVYQEIYKIKPILLLTKDLASIIFERDIIEICARDEDIALSGVFVFLKNIFHKFPEMREQFAEKNKLLQFIVHDCLFHKETSSQLISKQKALPPKCKNNRTREKCLDLLHELCQNNTEGLYLLIRYLKNYISETFWRTPRKNDWQINVHQQERSLTGFVGLKNIGCICYMNSIMQQLFMIPTFRKSMLEVEDMFYDKEPADENVLYQLKMIFGGLMETEKQYYNPKKFCGAFKDIDGSPIDPFVQKDVDEFFNMLMDRIESLTKGKREEKVIKNLFQGVFANEFICKGCPHYSEREEPFLAINLQVKNKNSIKESLDSFVEGEMLEGDNAYYCEKCEKKVNTLKRCCIKRMPNVLFMVLKRFEFNYDTMTKFKINDYCEYPMSINMSEYGQESLAKKDLLKEMQDKNLTIEDLNEEQRAILDRQIPSKYYEYNLKGVVIHMGTAEQGHYISIIQDRENPNGKWFEFNDHLVREFDPTDIPYETFGGDDDKFVNQFYQQNMQGGGMQNDQFLNAMKQLKTKIKNAYILIYEREEIIDMEKFSEIIDDPEVSTKKQEMAYRFDQCKIARQGTSNIQIPLHIHEQILEKNKKFWLSKFIFNKTYIDSVLKIFQNIPIQDDDDYLRARELDLQTSSGDQLELFKFLTTFFLTTVIRAKERKAIPSFMRVVREALQKNMSLSVWLLETFSNQNLIKEFLIDCPIPDMKRFVAGLLKTAMKKIYKSEEQLLANYSAQLDENIIEYINNSQSNSIKHHRTINLQQPTTQGEEINSSILCQNLNLFIISHHTKELPILVIFINSFIHLSVSFQNYRNMQMTGQFYQVFSHFASLGDQARLYLLKNRELGRLLEFLMTFDWSKQNALYSDKFRNESLQSIPLFKIEKDFYMESNLEKREVLLTIVERKAIIRDATPFLMFVAHTISMLSRSCRFVKSQIPNPYSIDQLNYTIDEMELGMIINYKNDQWWNVSNNSKLSRNAIADMFAHISFDNKEISLSLIQHLIDSLSKQSFENYKAFERALVKQVLIKDQYQPDRTKKAISSLYELIKINTQYYKDVDSLIEIIFKLLQRSQHAVELVNKQSQLYRFIDQWSKQQQYMPLNQQRTQIFRQGIINWNQIKNNMQVDQKLIDKLTAYTKDRLQKIQSLVNKEVAPNEDAYDSEDDMYGHQFQEKEKVDFRDQTGEFVFTGTVETCLDEMIRCVSDSLQPPGNKPACMHWIEMESEKIAPPYTMSQNEKRKIHAHYLKLLNALNQGNMGN